MLAMTLVFPLVAPSPASACPDCAEGVRAQVRRGIYGEGFGFNMLATALPFGVFLGITAALHTGLPPSRRS